MSELREKLGDPTLRWINNLTQKEESGWSEAELQDMQIGFERIVLYRQLRNKLLGSFAEDVDKFKMLPRRKKVARIAGGVALVGAIGTAIALASANGDGLEPGTPFGAAVSSPVSVGPQEQGIYKVLKEPQTLASDFAICPTDLYQEATYLPSAEATLYTNAADSQRQAGILAATCAGVQTASSVNIPLSDGTTMVSITRNDIVPNVPVTPTPTPAT